MYFAIESGYYEIAQLICENGGKVWANDEKIAKMLCQAAFDNDMQRIEMLKKSDVDLNVSDYDKRNVGHLAAAEGNHEILRYLATKTNFCFM